MSTLLGEDRQCRQFKQLLVICVNVLLKVVGENIELEDTVKSITRGGGNMAILVLF